MKTYYVRFHRVVSEQEIVTIAVEAKDEALALEKAMRGDGDEVDWRYYDREVEDENWDEAEVISEEEMGFLNAEEIA